MKILADVALPNAEEVLSEYGDVRLKPGREIIPADLQGTDILIIRSVTRVDENLLRDAFALKFVGTATAGVDHLDCALLSSRGIAFANAPGSNRESVGDYVLSVLLVLAQRFGLNFKTMSIGVIGCGNTGSEVCRIASALGMQLVKRDPPRFEQGDQSCGASLEEALGCDIVTLHVPLIREGPLKTRYLLEYSRLQSLKPGTVLINASRGEVVDNAALCRVLGERPDLKAWCDVFEGEPEISCRELLPRLQGATAHIAGYSYESKRRATVMLARSMARDLGLPSPRPYRMPEPELRGLELGEIATPDLDLLCRLVFAVYDVRRDSCAFARNFKDGKSFDLLRRNYRERRELSSLCLRNVPPAWRDFFSALGFTLECPAPAAIDLTPRSSGSEA